VRKRTEDKIVWFLSQMNHYGMLVAWDDETVDDFVAKFPEAEKSLIYYVIGHHVSPMLNRIANLAYSMRLVEPGSVGNTDARSYNRKTWARTWSITKKGREYLILKTTQ